MDPIKPELTIAELEYILFGREIPTPMDID